MKCLALGNDPKGIPDREKSGGVLARSFGKLPDKLRDSSKINDAATQQREVINRRGGFSDARDSLAL